MLAGEGNGSRSAEQSRNTPFYALVEAERLCAKCAEKFTQESMRMRLLVAQTPLLIVSLQVLSRLAEKFASLAVYAIRALSDFLTEPSPLLHKLYRHTNPYLDDQQSKLFATPAERNSKEFRTRQIFEKLRDTAIDGLCK